VFDKFEQNFCLITRKNSVYNSAKDMEILLINVNEAIKHKTGLNNCIFDGGKLVIQMRCRVYSWLLGND